MSVLGYWIPDDLLIAGLLGLVVAGWVTFLVLSELGRVRR